MQMCLESGGRERESCRVLGIGRKLARKLIDDFLMRDESY